MGIFTEPFEDEPIYDSTRDRRTAKKYSTKEKSIIEDGEMVDDKITTIHCSNCKKELALIWITRPTAKVKSYIIANCPFCNDKSFRFEFDGKICIGKAKMTNLVDLPCDIQEKDGTIFQNILINLKPTTEIIND